MKNDQAWNWFENGKVKEALRGEGKYFLADITFRESHDLVFILNQLMLWSLKGNLIPAAEGFMECMKSYIDNGNIKEALQLYFVYGIILKPEYTPLPINEEGIRLKIAEMMHSKASELATDEELRSLALRFLEKYPEFNEKVGLSSG